MGEKYLDSLERAYFQGKHVGERVGQQTIFDCAMVYLIRNGWDGKQIVDFFDGTNAIIDEFDQAYKPCQEQDVIQARLDAIIADALNGVTDFMPFPKRYPEIKTMGYDKPIREERHPATRKKGKKR